MHESAGVHSVCFHSIIHERRWIIHGYYVSRRKLQTTTAVFLCLSRCINLRRPPREDDLSAEMSRWPSRFTRLLSARRERGSLRIICLSVSYWPSVQLTFSVRHKHIKRRRRAVIATACGFSTHMLSEGCRKTLNVSFSAGKHKKKSTKASNWSLYSDFSVVCMGKMDIYQNSDFIQNLNSNGEKKWTLFIYL